MLKHLILNLLSSLKRPNRGSESWKEGGKEWKKGKEGGKEGRERKREGRRKEGRKEGRKEKNPKILLKIWTQTKSCPIAA